MTHSYGLSFETEGDRFGVSARTYVDTLQALVGALASVRQVVAPLLAARRGWPVAQVVESLEMGLAPADGESRMVVLVVLGANRQDVYLDRGKLESTYWRLAGRMLTSATQGRDAAIALTADGAESFAEAVRRARSGRATLRLVRRRAPHDAFTTWVDLDAMERPLRAYAEQRQRTRLAPVQLVGQLDTLSSESATMTLVTGNGRRTVYLPTDLREVARKLWGQDIIADVDASMTVEGHPRSMDATAIRAVPRLDEVDFDKTLGAGEDVWAGDDARAYLDDLRTDRERR